jgi:uncharacterized protein YcfL
MRKIVLAATLCGSFLFVGCSGKVQTNPIPEDRKFVLPSAKKEYNNTISEHFIIDFRAYANQKLRVEKYNTIQANKQFEANNNNESKFWNAIYKGSK